MYYPQQRLAASGKISIHTQIRKPNDDICFVSGLSTWHTITLVLLILQQERFWHKRGHYIRIYCSVSCCCRKLLTAASRSCNNLMVESRWIAFDVLLRSGQATSLDLMILVLKIIASANPVKTWLRVATISLIYALIHSDSSVNLYAMPFYMKFIPLKSQNPFKKLPALPACTASQRK